MEISKSQVQYVSLKEKGGRGKTALIAGTAGFGAGMGVVVATFGTFDTHGGAGQKTGLACCQV
jgi:hypothetical protein